MNGAWEGRYNSPSEADIALCNLLAFWFRKEELLVDKWFRQSGLYREKWDEKHGNLTYGQITIRKAINDIREVYEPGRKKQNIPKVEPPEIDLGYDQLYGPVVDEVRQDGYLDAGTLPATWGGAGYLQRSIKISAGGADIIKTG
jgi:putative DNA primase/helicase